VTTKAELSQIASELAESLEAAIPMCTTRIEHIRVSGHAARARALAQALESPSTTSDPLPVPPMVFAPPVT